MQSNINDRINPQHYKQGEVECIDAIAAATVNKPGIQAVCVANVIKYLWRYEEKGGIEDIRKAQWYLEKLIKDGLELSCKKQDPFTEVKNDYTGKEGQR